MPFPQPSSHVQSHSQDVWSLINEAAAEAEKEQGRPVVNLGQGFFSYAPPDFALAAAKKAIDVPAFNQYSPTRGRPELLQALSRTYSKSYLRELDPKSEILVTAGANEGMYAAFTAFLDDGDEVIVFEPFFDQYISNIKLPGGVVKYVPLHPPADAAVKTSTANNWYIDFAELEAAITPRTKMIVLNSPHNPIGKVFTEDELLKISALALKHNIIMLSDEVYDSLYYGKFTRLAALSPEVYNLTLTVGSAGKTFAATGWRVGWVIGPEHLLKYVAAAHTRIVFCVNTPLQIASSEALEVARTGTYYQDTVKMFKHKYSLLQKVFDELNLPYSISEGGYFLLVNFAKVQVPDDFKFPESIKGRPRDFRLAFWLINQFGVVAIPPTEFVTPPSYPLLENYLRFAVCKDDHLLEEAVVRLRALKDYVK